MSEDDDVQQLCRCVGDLAALAPLVAMYGPADRFRDTLQEAQMLAQRIQARRPAAVSTQL